jgi:hypothetical protein
LLYETKFGLWHLPYTIYKDNLFLNCLKDIL